MARETTVYLRRHLVLEPWGTAPAMALGGPPPPRACPECSAPVAGGDAFCRSCGAPLGTPTATRG